MDEVNNLIHLTDEDGNNVLFEFLDLIEYNGNEYVILLPIDASGEVVILKVAHLDDSENESYVGVEDQAVLDAVFGLFRARFQDEFNFVD